MKKYTKFNKKLLINLLKLSNIKPKTLLCYFLILMFIKHIASYIKMLLAKFCYNKLTFSLYLYNQPT